MGEKLKMPWTLRRTAAHFSRQYDEEKLMQRQPSDEKAAAVATAPAATTLATSGCENRWLHTSVI